MLILQNQCKKSMTFLRWLMMILNNIDIIDISEPKLTNQVATVHQDVELLYGADD